MYILNCVFRQQIIFLQLKSISIFTFAADRLILQTLSVRSTWKYFLDWWLIKLYITPLQNGLSGVMFWCEREQEMWYVDNRTIQKVWENENLRIYDIAVDMLKLNINNSYVRKNT